MILKAIGLTKHFGGLSALEGFNLDIDEDEIVGLIGPNGAGKTTAVNVITGYLRPNAGKVIFQGQDITGCPSHIIAQKGISRTFQLGGLFPEVTLSMAVSIGLHLKTGCGLAASLVNTKSFRAEENRVKEMADDFLEFMGIDEHRNRLVKDSPHEVQSKVGIAMAIASGPKLLLLDEAAAGFNLQEAKVLLQLIKKINKQGISLLVIDHDMNLIMNLCDRIVVMNHGQILAEGTPTEIKRSPEVINAYMGKRGSNA